MRAFVCLSRRLHCRFRFLCLTHDGTIAAASRASGELNEHYPSIHPSIPNGVFDRRALLSRQLGCKSDKFSTHTQSILSPLFLFFVHFSKHIQSSSSPPILFFFKFFTFASLLHVRHFPRFKVRFLALPSKTEVKDLPATVSGVESANSS